MRRAGQRAGRGCLRARPGRADLLYALARRDEVGLAEMAALLDYDEVVVPASEPMAAPVEKEVVEPVETDADATLRRVPFWRLETYEDLPVEDEGETSTEAPKIVEPLTDQTLVPRAGEKRRPAPIVADAAVHTAFDRLLDSRQPSRRIDIDALTEALGTGRQLAELPVLHTAGWSPRLLLLIDRSQRLIPFWHDQNRLARDLIARLGTHAVRIWGWSESSTVWRDRFGARLAQPPFDEAEAVLALSDLGAYGDARDQARWARWGRQARAKAASAAALVPCPADRWTRATAGLWNAQDWSAPNRRGRGGTQSAHTAIADGAELLLTLASVATRIEPGLLRDLRKLIPEVTSLSSEADAWAHPDLARFSSVAGQLDTAAQRRRRAAFRQQPRSLKEQVVETLRAWRAGARQEIWWEEYFALLGDPDLEDVLRPERDHAIAFTRQLAATAEANAQGAERLFQERTERWVRRFGQRLHARDAWVDDELGKPLRNAWQAAWRGYDHVPLPAGMGPAMFGTSPQGERAWTLGQRGADIVFEPAGGQAGSPLGAVDAAEPSIKIGDGVAPAITLQSGQRVSLPDGSATVLRTDRTQATLRKIVCPGWANDIGRDRFGLWASFEVEDIEQRMRWIPPGRYWMGSPANEPGRKGWEVTRHLEVVAHGFWLADTPCTQALWHAVTGDAPSHFDGLERPVERVSWDDCTWFFATLNDQITGLDLRLPLEVEWEYACRAGTNTATYARTFEADCEGKAGEFDAIAWYSPNSGRKTNKVGEKAPNSWGLYDTLGNVHEWCEDQWREDHDSDPQGTDRVIRGGSWFSSARSVRAAYRDHGEPSDRGNNLGFRLARGQGARESAELAGAGRRNLIPSWATGGGRDGKGRWASFEIEGVVQRLRWIEPGRFWMGSPEDEPGGYPDEGPRHEVGIEAGFWLAETPCTQAFWQAVVGENPSQFQGADRPVESVSWNDCQAFLKNLEGWFGILVPRLPAEAEWEYACRAGTETATYAGTFVSDESGRAEELDAIAWYGHNIDSKTQPVAQKGANPWGLYDMLGNVGEWCQDSWRDDYYSEFEDTYRVIRGGSWSVDARYLRAAYRNHVEHKERWSYLGFRLALGQPALESAEPVDAERLRDGARRGMFHSRDY